MFHFSISIIQLISILRKPIWLAYLTLVVFVLFIPVADADQPNWVLSGTFVDANDAHAMFVDENGDELLVQLGDDIQGCDLMDVLHDSAKLRCKGKDYDLQLRSSVGDLLLQAEYEESQMQKATVVLSKNEVTDYVSEKQRLVSEIGFLPLIEGRQVVRYTLSKIKPDTKAASLGLHNRDVIKSVSGVSASQSELFVQTIQELTDVPEVTIEIDRSGQWMAYKYIID